MKNTTKQKFKIFDWIGNDLTYFHGVFDSFDSAEEHLSDFLGENYETDRQEYEITEILGV